MRILRGVRRPEGEPRPEIVTPGAGRCHDRAMGNAQYPPDAGPGAMGRGAPRHPARARPPARAGWRPADRLRRAHPYMLRSALAGVRSRRVLGWVLLVAWAAWLVAVWVTQPRLVPQDFAADELAKGNCHRLFAGDRRRGRADEEASPGPDRLDVAPVSGREDLGESLDGTYGGTPAKLARTGSTPPSPGCAWSTPTACRRRSLPRSLAAAHRGRCAAGRGERAVVPPVRARIITSGCC